MTREEGISNSSVLFVFLIVSSILPFFFLSLGLHFYKGWSFSEKEKVMQIQASYVQTEKVQKLCSEKGKIFVPVPTVLYG